VSGTSGFGMPFVVGDVGLLPGDVVGLFGDVFYLFLYLVFL